METHSKLQLYGVLHLTFGLGNTIANLIYINIIINKGRERNCSPHNTDGYICEDFNSLWTVQLFQMAVLCSVWVFIFLYNFCSSIFLFFFLGRDIHVYMFKPNSAMTRILRSHFFPLTRFDITPLVHCITNRLALCPAP